MSTFIVFAAALAVAALVLLLHPWRRRIARADFTRALNAAIHRDRLAELERDRAAGVLSAADFVEAGEELQQQLLEDTAAADDGGAATGGRGTSIALALFLPLAAVLLYLLLGSPNALLTSVEREQKATASMDELVEKLAKKLEADPGNTEGWAMLARSYKSVGRLDDAERAFLRAGPELEKNATLMADFADLLIQKNKSFEGRPRELLRKALSVDPNDPMTLWLLGTDAFDNGRYNEAIRHWEHLLTLLDPASDDARAIESGLAEAQKRGGRSTRGGAGVGAGVTAPKATASASASAVSGRVELAPALRAKARPDDVVFIFARAVNGPRMPLAAQRARVADLPLEFSLDDSQALTPELKISTAGELRIEARVSKSGDAAPGPGDLSGKSSVVKPGAKGVTVRIDSAD